MVSTQMERLNSFPELHRQIHRRLVELLEKESRFNPCVTPYQKRTQARILVGNIIDQVKKDLSPQIISQLNCETLIKDVLDQTLGLGPLEDLIHNPDISEIMINGCKHIYIEKDGLLKKLPPCFHNAAEVMAVIEKIVSPLGRRIDEGSPMVDARLPDGSRVNAIIPPLALTGPCLTIRKFKPVPFTPQELIENQTLNLPLLQFLKVCVEGRLNILISGGTGTGKTTLLNLLSSFIPQGERIITIEDAAELRLPQEHVISLESRPANVEGAGEIPIRALVRNALRMRPDRIVVGECRGGEALDMLQAMNTGHDGSLTTGHANDTRDMLLRLETMVLMSGVELPIRAIREQIASALDLILQLERFADGRRRLVRVSEVCGMEGDIITTQDIFLFEAKPHPHIHATGMIPHFRKKLQARGRDLPSDFFLQDSNSRRRS